MFSVVPNTRNSSTTHRSSRTTWEKRTVTWFWSCTVACLTVVVVCSRRILNSLLSRRRRNKTIAALCVPDAHQMCCVMISWEILAITLAMLQVFKYQQPNLFLVKWCKVHVVRRGWLQRHIIMDHQACRINHPVTFQSIHTLCLGTLWICSSVCSFQFAEDFAGRCQTWNFET